ncbi:MAG TPA: amidohydrolase family protein [Thermoanaerobaculia bacterium]|nr:amidohydrolase family protein [Thermoanaerobaculia bacterium]
MTNGRPHRAKLQWAALLLLPAGATAAPPPVLDVHLHALGAADQGPPPLAMCTPLGTPFPAWDGASPWPESFLAMLETPACDDPVWSPKTDRELMERSLAELERHNVYGVVSGSAERVATWRESAPERLIPGLVFRLEDDVPTPDELRAMHERGTLRVLGEVITQYQGIAPDDPRLEPYWELAEELDLPVGIHVGTGPPGASYLGTPGYRARLHSALTMEDVLVRHPRLRVYLMHAGYPMIDDLLTLLYAHPQVYVDVGVIVYTQPRAAFYRYLERIVEAGFGNRVLFGSDQMVWPEVIGRAIEVIREAPFLDERQKRAILYDNAARFLRLSAEEIARHHRATTRAP